MDKKLKRVFTSLKSTSSSSAAATTAPSDTDTPETTLTRNLTLFCSPNTPSGSEVTYLPTIVDLVEASPNCRTLTVRQLRKNLSLSCAPQTQYNAIMLLRILSDNPGPSFTRHIGSDAKFVPAVKELIRKGRDPGVWGILRETLVHWNTGAMVDHEGLKGVRDMWAKEKELIDAAVRKRSPNTAAAATLPPSQQAPPPPELPPRIPNPVELASRIAEASSSAKLLEQVVQSTPAAEVRSNELVREFVERCKLAEKSIKGYITAGSGGSGGGQEEQIDVETLATLIDTHEALLKSLKLYKDKCPSPPQPSPPPPPPPPPPPQLEQPVAVSPVSPVSATSPVSALEAAVVRRPVGSGPA